MRSAAVLQVSNCEAVEPQLAPVPRPFSGLVVIDVQALRRVNLRIALAGGPGKQLLYLVDSVFLVFVWDLWGPR